MSVARAVIPLCLSVLASCATVRNPSYQSRAPELRGVRAIASSIDLVSEVYAAGPGFQHAVIGVFYLRDVFGDDGSQGVLLGLRGATLFNRGRTGTINDYNLKEISSLTVEQARQLIDAMGTYLATDPKSIPPTRMISYELSSGTADSSQGNDAYRPLREVTFAVAFSVTAAGKSFEATFPPAVAGSYTLRPAGNRTFDLDEQKVKDLRDAITAAVGKSTPRVAP